jgi:hypothetical protein
LAVFWIGSGVINLISLVQAAEQLGLAGFGPSVSRAVVEAASAFDIAVGLLVCIRRTAPLALKGMVLFVLAYIVAGTIWRRDLWLDPLGPLLKMLPVGVLALAALAMLKSSCREA